MTEKNKDMVTLENIRMMEIQVKE